MAHDDLGATQQQARPSEDPPAPPMPDAAPVTPQAPPTPYPPQAPMAPQGYYPPHGYYPPQGHCPPLPPHGTPVLAIVGLALAIVVPPVGVVLSIAALILAWQGGKGSGRGLAIGGVVAGTVITLIAAGALLVVLDRERDERAVRNAFERFAHSIVDVDCKAYMASTTPALRQELGMAKCDQFVDIVAAIDGRTVRGLEASITGVEVHGDTATVSVIENLGVNWLGGPTIQPVDYTLVHSGNTWLLDGLTFGD